MTAYEPNVVLSTQEYKVVGTRPIRHDGLDKVTGRALYGADVDLPGLLYGALLRSPHAHECKRGESHLRCLGPLTHHAERWFCELDWMVDSIPEP